MRRNALSIGLALGLLTASLALSPSIAEVSVGTDAASAPLAAATQSDGSAPTSREEIAAADAMTIAQQEGRSLAAVEVDLMWQNAVQAARAGAEIAAQQFGAETVARVDAVTGRTEVFVAMSAPSNATARTSQINSEVDGELTVHFDPNSRGEEDSLTVEAEWRMQATPV